MKDYICVIALLLATSVNASGQPAAQNPSPMVEHTRLHTRLVQERPAGQRFPLPIGTLFLPEKLAPGPAPLWIQFHGGTWLPEVAAARQGLAVLTVQLGSGSAAYGKPFADPKVLADLIADAETKASRKFTSLGLSGWSAGYGAIRAILKAPEHYDRVEFVLLLDGLHAGYVGGKPGPKESSLLTDDLGVFVQFARDAAVGKKRLLVTHTEIFPGTFASTTETADYLLQQLKLARQPVLRWGPLGTQILSEANLGGFHLLGFAGNSAPDHVDLLHALPDLLALVTTTAQASDDGAPAIPVTVAATVEPGTVKAGAPILLTIKIANGLRGTLAYSAFGLKPDGRNSETVNLSLVDVYRDGKVGNLFKARPKMESAPRIAGLSSHRIKPGSSLTVATDAGQWEIEGGWIPGRYRLTVRVENLTTDGERCRLSVQSEPCTFEIRAP